MYIYTTFTVFLKALITLNYKMPNCGFCGDNGHNIRHCVSLHIPRVVAAQQDSTSLGQLNNYLHRCAIPLLNVIMISYGAPNLSMNRLAKEQFIREHWLITHPQALAIQIPAPAPAQVHYEPHSPVGPPPVRDQVHYEPHSPVGPPPVRVQSQVQSLYQSVNHVFESAAQNRDAHTRRMLVIAESIFARICVTKYHLTRFSVETEREFNRMLRELSVNIIVSLQANNSFWRCDALVIAKHILKKFRLPRANGIAVEIKASFIHGVIHDYEITSNHQLDVMYATRYRAEPQQQQVYVPYKPAFAAVEVFGFTANESDDYSCGICSEDYTRSTIPMLNCNHTLCYDCIAGQIKARTKSCITCPFCREEVKYVTVEDAEIMDQISTIVSVEVSVHC